MTLQDWITESRERIKHDGVRTGTYASAQEFWAGALGQFGRHVWNYGEPVFERDWDVLLVFDACRVDIMEEVARSGEYDVLDSFDPDRDSMNSVASRSPEWIAKTFDPEKWGRELAETAYVTANLHSRDIPDPDRLRLFDEVWRYGWDDDVGVVPPRPMTDRAIDVMRTHSPNRLIVHYMQPHLPFRSLVDDHPEWFNFKPGLDNPAPEEFKTLWRRLRDGEVDRDTVWNAYVDNLRWVMDEVEILRENLDAEKVVITADHANAMGEWWCYGHQSPAPLPAMKRVPWVEFSATDERTYDPEVVAEDVDLSEDEYKDRLRHLGYI